jgi:signal transduction histidine kinase
MITGVVSYYTFREAVRDRTFDQLTSLRIEKRKQVLRFFSVQEERLKEISILFHSSRKNTNVIDSSLIFQLQKSDITDMFSGVWILEKGNQEKPILVYSGDSVEFLLKIPQNVTKKLTPAMAEIKSGSFYYIDYENSETKDIASLYILYRPTKGSHYFLCSISESLITDIMYEVNPDNGMGTTGETYLVGSDMLMRTHSRFHPNSVLNTLVNTEVVVKGLQGISGTRTVNDYRGIPVLSSFEPLCLKNLNWVILSEMDVKEVMQPVYSLRNNLLLIAAIIATIIFVLAVFVSSTIVRPLQKLNAAFVSIAGGNLDVKVDSDTSDELGNLVQAFNAMAKDLKTKSIELEKERLRSFQQFLEGQEMERRRTAREIHDSLGQLLVVLKMRYEKLMKAQVAENEQSTVILDLINETIIEARRISNDLSSTVLQELGLVDAVKGLTQSLQGASGIHFQLKAEGDFSFITAYQSAYIYRIVQEAMNNILKHAAAEKALIVFTKEHHFIRFSVEDNGTGFDKNSYLSGNGISNMKDRVRIMGGSIDITTFPGKGTKIEVTIPCIKND